MEVKRTEVSEYGEFKLIDHLTKDFKINPAHTTLGIGDDAAVLDFQDKRCVVTTDLLVEGIHFDLSYTPLRHLGYKAVAVNVSDICAMNAKPTSITFSLAISNRFSVEALEELYAGVRIACEKYNVDLIGGDTSSAHQGMVLSITALGEIGVDDFVTRSNAKEGDLICVTGDLGGAYAGLQLLEREKKIFEQNPAIQPNISPWPYIVGRILKPEARIDIIAWLASENIQPSSMMDISDGLSSELLHICKQSGVGCMIYEDKIPIHEETARMAAEFKIPKITCALNGGEDYELVFTIPPSLQEKMASSPYITIIGEVTAASKQANITTLSGNIYPLQAQGWNAFTSS